VVFFEARLLMGLLGRQSLQPGTCNQVQCYCRVRGTGVPLPHAYSDTGPRTQNSTKEMVTK